MGQVLGFSHCQDYGSVASTPDSTPPCTDGGNEESEMYELQTAREWSDDDDEEVGGPEDDEGQASPASVWGTPRQNSFELTFSYIAIAEAEAVGVSRHHRDRRRGGPRVGRASPLIQTDALEMLLDSPDVDWDPQAFLTQEEDVGTTEGSRQEGLQLGAVSPTHRRDTITGQSTEHGDTEGGDADLECGEGMSQAPPLSAQIIQAAEASSNLQPEVPVSMETTLAQLLTSACQSQAVVTSQERLVGDRCFSAPGLTGEQPSCLHVAVMDLIYWKDTERSGVALTGLVVALLSLFQLSIITVVSTVSLAVMCFTISVRLYYQVLYVLSWGHGEHPFRSYLDMDISFSGEQADLYMQKLIFTVLSSIDSLRRLFFVENLLESLKLLFLMYLMTYLGGLCNGLTVLIISVIAVFSLPLFYKHHQEQVDRFLAKLQTQFDNILDTLRRLAQGGGPPPDSTPGGAKPKTQ